MLLPDASTNFLSLLETTLYGHILLRVSLLIIEQPAPESINAFNLIPLTMHFKLTVDWSSLKHSDRSELLSPLISFTDARFLLLTEFITKSLSIPSQLLLSLRGDRSSSGSHKYLGHVLFQES